MNNRSMLLALIVFLVALLLLVPGCAPDEPDVIDDVDDVDVDDVDEVDEEKVLRVSIAINPNTIEPATSDVRQGANVAWSIFDSLVWLSDDLDIVPALAEDWEVSEDGTVYTFYLREGVTFHNGFPFTAEDVVFTWERGREPGITYREDFLHVIEMNIIDEYTVEMILEEPNAMLMMLMNEHWGILSKQYHEEVGEEGYMQEPVGTGPFKFVEWLHGDQIVLDAFEGYWKPGYPKVDRVVFKIIPDPSTRYAALVRDEIDIINLLPPELTADVEAADGVELVRYPLDRVFYIAFNNMTTGVGTPIENKLVRQALSYAVDYDAIINTIFEGQADRIHGFVVPGNLGYDPSFQPYPYDPERAKELLAEAGYPDGFTMGLAGPAETYINFEEVLLALTKYFEDIGVMVDLELMESGVYWTLQAGRELPPMYGDSWSSSMGEAFPRIYGALSGWDASYCAWYDPVIIDMIRELQLAVDPDDRAEVYRQIQEYMLDDPPFIYLYQPVNFEAINERVKNYNPRSSEAYYLEGVSLE